MTEEMKKDECHCEEETCECADQNAENTKQCDCEIVEENGEKIEKKKFFTKKNKEEELHTRIAELEGECTRLKNEYLKAYADTENTRKRLQQDFENRQKYRIQSFALEILPAIDNLERALAQTVTPENESYVKGVEMIYNQLMYALKQEGVEEVNPIDEVFDANFHHAIMAEKIEGIEANQVVQVLQKGYKLKDRILRPAMVKVSE